jgi:hypothetical protein
MPLNYSTTRHFEATLSLLTSLAEDSYEAKKMKAHVSKLLFSLFVYIHY